VVEPVALVMRLLSSTAGSAVEVATAPVCADDPAYATGAEDSGRRICYEDDRCAFVAGVMNKPANTASAAKRASKRETGRRIPDSLSPMCDAGEQVIVSMVGSVCPDVGGARNIL